MICRSGSALGRLNAFQRLMLQWSELHPYNAAHVYRIARPCRPEALADAVRQTYSALGIGIAEVNAEDLSYRYQIDREPEIETVGGDGDPASRLADYVTRELNRPFDRPRCSPWRFGVLESGSGVHDVIAVYDHWTADSVAARLVLRHVLDRYCGWNVPEHRTPLELYPGTCRELFPHRLRGVSLVRSGVNSLRHWACNRSAAQVPFSSNLHMDVRFELCRAAEETVPRLRWFARSLGATVHDVILAALGRTMARCLSRRAARRGQAMSLGTIVDARGDAQEDLGNTLGTFLGYYVTRLAADPGMTLADAVRRVAAATGPIKAKRLYLDSLFNAKIAGALWPRLRETAKPHFMRKLLPMTAGVSNVVVRDRWMHPSGGVVEYFRGAPTGPSVPLVLSPTTLGDMMNIGLTYRTAGFSRRKIDAVMEMFLEQIEQPDACGPRRGAERAASARRTNV